jgi:hypothetical protein
MPNRIAYSFKPLILPFLLAILPSLFQYGNNASILLLSSLIRMVMFYGALAIVLYIIRFLFSRRQPTQAANATFVFLIFFNIYGAAYNYLLKLDIVQVEHYTLLPFFILLAVYASWLITRIKAAYSIRFWNSMVYILSVLAIFNIIKIIPPEAEKGKRTPENSSMSVVGNASLSQGYPDIYYIVFDEFSGFEPMREYWHNLSVDDFIHFLATKGFFVAEQSHSSSIDTLHEMATRLNYQEYTLDAPGSPGIWFDAIADNNVMHFLKAQGYTTVVFSEIQYPYPSALPIVADYSFNYAQDTRFDLELLFDEFGRMTADNTMLRAFSKLYTIDNPSTAMHRNMILFTQAKIADLDEIQSPRFVYLHLMLPHFPFMFDKNGNLIDPTFFYNWNYYLGNYNYAIHVAEEMVDNILLKSNPDRLPIIILQSDHGARNQGTANPSSVILENYPEEYKTSILFALYMPGYDVSALHQDVDPINTFPIVFNYLFDANIPLK